MKDFNESPSTIKLTQEYIDKCAEESWDFYRKSLQPDKKIEEIVKGIFMSGFLMGVGHCLAKDFIDKIFMSHSGMNN